MTDLDAQEALTKAAVEYVAAKAAYDQTPASDDVLKRLLDAEADWRERLYNQFAAARLVASFAPLVAEVRRLRERVAELEGQS